ncbi:IniB N-terminal domain-containing protein [Actinomycetes bacterium KLBMP 9797]
MESTQTLHDFVLNLLTNAEARSAFELDPEGALTNAGLSDITAADVRDVVPLVVDYAPVQGVTQLTPVTDLGALDTDATDVVGQLQAVTNQLAVGAQSTSADVNVAALGAITADSSGINLGTSSLLPDLGAFASPYGAGVDLSGVHDVAGTLDADVVSPVTADATGAVDTTVGTADGLVGGASVDGLLGTTDGLLGSTDGTLGTVTGTLDQTTDLVDSLGLPVDVPSVGSVTSGAAVDDVTGGVTGTVTGTVDSTVGGTLDGLGVGGLLSGSASADAHASADAGGVTDILF